MTSPEFLPSISRRQISRRQMLRGFGALTASSVLSGCGASLYRTLTPATSAQPAPSQSSTTAPAAPIPAPTAPSAPPAQPPAAPVLNEQPLPVGAITSASMTIGSSAAVNFGEGFVGLAYEKQALSTPLFTANNGNLVGLFRRLGSSVLRIGGNSVDRSVWTPGGTGQTPGQIAPSDIDALAAFLQQTGWTCIYGLNLGGSATGATTPALAAAEVAYAVQQMGSSLIGIELGNECETYGDPGSFYEYDWTVEKFESVWQQYRDAIVAAVPGAPLTGPAAASDVDGWTIPFGEYVTNDQINLLTQTYHRSDAAASVENLISPDTALTAELQQLREGAQSMDVPFRVAGCNSYSGGGVAGVSNAYAASLWAIDMIFNCALGGASGVNFEGGNQGIFSPIADVAGTVTGAQPVFYGLLMAAMAGPGTLLATQLSAASLNVTGYAVQSPGGGMSLVVVNKDATQNLDLSTALPQSMTSATLQAMTQLSAGAMTPSLSALSGVSIQGATIAADGTFDPGAVYDLTVTGTQISCYVPALSAVLIQVS